MTPKRKFLTVLLLGSLTTIVPFSIDMYLPGFPDIAVALHTTVSSVALSLSSFFIGIGIGQLLYGPLLDRFGRKKPLYAGLLLYCVASVGCALSNSIEMLIALRFVQAIGACAGSIAATAMVRDFFPPEENAKIFSFLMLVLSVSPMLAPTIGSYISVGFGWGYIFIVLTFLIVLIFFGVLLFLPQSRPPDKDFSLRPAAILKSYRDVLREKYFYFYALSGGIALASLFTYIASSPGIFIGYFSLTKQQYGLLFALLAAGLIISSQVNTLLLRKYKSESVTLGAIIAQNVIALTMFLLSITGHLQFWGLVAFLFCYLSSVGFILPNASALAMRPFEKNAGSASALLGFIQMGLGSLATVGIGVLHIQGVRPMTTAMALASLLGLIVCALSVRALRGDPSEAGTPA